MAREYTDKQREEQRARVRAHYQANKEYYKKKAKTANAVHNKILRDFIAEYLTAHPCVDCGNSDLRVLEFDHVRGEKKFNVSEGTSMNHWVSLEVIQEEVAKCEVRCANCHRIVTVERGGWHNSIMSS